MLFIRKIKKNNISNIYFRKNLFLLVLKTKKLYYKFFKIMV